MTLTDTKLQSQRRNNMKTNVEFGAKKDESGKWWPFIAFVTPEGGRVEFTSNKSCSSEEQAGLICKGAFHTLQVDETTQVHFTDGAV